MKIEYEYSHLGGAEILRLHYPEIEQEIYNVISKVQAIKQKISAEKTTKGRLLFSPKLMNQQFKKYFSDLGYKELRDRYDIQIPNYPKVIKGTFKQIDFVKKDVLIEVQFGKYAFMFYDLAKFQYFFNENKAAVGVEIVPSYDLHKQMSTGVSYGEQLIYDIERLRRHFPAVPIKVILISD